MIVVLKVGGIYGIYVVAVWSRVYGSCWLYVVVAFATQLVDHRIFNLIIVCIGCSTYVAHVCAPDHPRICIYIHVY